jgi:mRNA interferase RelE/StbE
LKYRLEIKPRALKELGRIGEPEQSRIQRRIDALADHPRPAGAKKLQGRDYWSIRVGDYRVLYRIEDNVLVILVVRVGHRKDVYRKMENISWEET